MFLFTDVRYTKVYNLNRQFFIFNKTLGNHREKPRAGNYSQLQVQIID